jgi:DNA-binding response OmpR family regulator
MAQILIVEDDESFAYALAAMLRLEGYDVLVAFTAYQGVELGLAHCPDVVIADWMLKHHLHGGDVCGWIRAACPHVKTIFMTGYLDKVPQVDRWSAHMETIIEKPFHKERLLEAVNRALSRTTELAANIVTDE